MLTDLCKALSDPGMGGPGTVAPPLTKSRGYSRGCGKQSASDGARY